MSDSGDLENEIQFTQACFVLGLDEIIPMVLEKSFIFVIVFSQFRNYLYLKKVLNLHNFETPLPKDTFCQDLCETGQEVSEKIFDGSAFMTFYIKAESFVPICGT